MRILVLMVLLAATASAEENNYYTWGAGLISCGAWTENRKEENWYNESQWLLGFLSADSFYRNLDDWAPAERPDSTAMLTWVDNYCSENPLDLTRDAALALIAELVKRAE